MLNSKNNKGIEVTELFLNTASLSIESLQERITEVKYSSVYYSEAFDSVTFKIDSSAYVGHLKGRNHSLMLGSDNQNKAIAARVIVDGDYEPLI